MPEPSVITIGMNIEYYLHLNFNSNLPGAYELIKVAKEH